jgi:hypothetical protein
MKTAVTTIQQTGQRPKSMPYPAEYRLSFAGMPYTKTEMATAMASALTAAQWPFMRRNARAQKR